MDALVNALSDHRVVEIDTSIFIYHLEGSTRYAAAVARVFDMLEEGRFLGVTSLITLLELTMRPLQLQRPDIAEGYELLLITYPNLTIVDFDRAVIRRPAERRATYRLVPPDAMQVAGCLHAGATAMLSNDKTLRRVSELDVVILDDFVTEYQTAVSSLNPQALNVLVSF